MSRGEYAMDEEGQKIGIITHYFTKIGVAVIKLDDTLKIGDTIHIKGATSNFSQVVDKMQIDRKDIEEASAGQSIGLKVNEHVREHDVVCRV